MTSVMELQVTPANLTRVQQAQDMHRDCKVTKSKFTFSQRSKVSDADIAAGDIALTDARPEDNIYHAPNKFTLVDLVGMFDSTWIKAMLPAAMYEVLAPLIDDDTCLYIVSQGESTSLRKETWGNALDEMGNLLVPSLVFNNKLITPGRRFNKEKVLELYGTETPFLTQQMWATTVNKECNATTILHHGYFNGQIHDVTRATSWLLDMFDEKGLPILNKQAPLYYRAYLCDKNSKSIFTLTTPPTAKQD